MLSRAVRGRLAALERRYSLGEPATASLGELLLVLEQDRHAPTPIREPYRAVDLHVADSLSALELEPVHNARSIADLGAGPGFPGLALAAALPDASVVLVESAARKAEFLVRAARRSGLGNVHVVADRVESWNEGREASELVTARALAALPIVLEYAAPLMRIGGHLVAYRGRPDPGEELTASTAAALLGLELVEVRHVTPYAGAENRNLHVYTKIHATPPGFPRRPGIARKRPLGLTTSSR
jgi:16S rRNA (guanine527-N7)-methyltransferase